MSAIDGRNPVLKKQRIPPVNTDFITQVQNKSPHLVEPLRILTQKMNEIINNVNAKSSFHRTLLLKNLAPGTDIADHVPIRIEGTAMAYHVSVRLKLTKDLKVVIHCYAPSYSGPIAKIVVPKEAHTFGPPHTTVQPVLAKVGDMATFTAEILESDSQKDVNGVVSITFEWQS